MAGKPGMTGGGGARPGAGRPKKPKPAPVALEVPTDGADMLDLLQRIALGHVDATTVQVRAAIAAVQYTHVKKGDGGKKEEVADAAKKAAGGKFAAAAAPRLVAAGGKKI